MFIFKPKFMIPLALISGLFASYGVFSYLKNEQEQMKTRQNVTRPVVVAAYPIALGTPLKIENLQVKQWPEDLVPDSSFQNVNEIIGRVMKTDVIAGEPILSTKLAPTGSGGGVPGLIPSGMRAFTVAVTVVSGVGGFILPGTRVDVLATVSPNGMKAGTTTKTILQNVEVLAVDQTYNKNNDTDPVVVKSVTLVVSPDEAEKLALASNEGKLQLVLRNGTDLEMRNTDGVKISQFNGHIEPEPQPRIFRPRPEPVKIEEEEEEEPARVVEVIRANVRSEIAFEPNGSTRKKTSKQ